MICLSTRKQIAKEKRSRQYDVISDFENLDVTLGNYTTGEIRGQEDVDQIEIDPESSRRQQDLDQNEPNYRSLRNTNLSENSEITVETSRMINSEISSQMSRKIEEMKSDLNSHILGENFPRSIAASSNQNNHRRENPIEFDQSDDEGYDMVTGANLTPHTVPEFLTGRPMQSRKNIPQQNDDNDDMLDTTIPAQQMPMRTTEATTEPPIDPINRLADVIMGMNSKSSAQTLMVRPVSTTTLTFDGKSEKFELFEDLFHTMIKMQPDMTESIKINHFHSLLRKNALQTFRNINSANRQTLEDILAVFRRKCVKPESRATAKHKWHKLVFDPNTMKLPDCLEELNQGAEKAFGEHAQAMIDSFLYANYHPN